MQVLIKKSVLEQLLKQIVEDRGYRSRRIDQIAGDGQPVLPDAQMATQLSTPGVPVSDPDFLPVNKQQLSSAASQMAHQVAPDKLQKFYSGLKKLIRKTGEKKQYKGMSDTDLLEEGLGNVIRKLIAEADEFGLPKRRDDTSMSREEQAKLKDLTQAALQRAATGGAQTLAAVQARQDAAIRRAKGIKPRYRGADEDRYNVRSDISSTEPTEDEEISVFDIKPRPTIGPVELDDRTIGDANRILDILEKNKMPLPKSFTEMHLEVEFYDAGDQLIIRFKHPDLSGIFYKTEYEINDDGTLPFTKGQYMRSLVTQFKEALKSRPRKKGKRQYDEEPVISGEAEGITDEDIYYKGLQDLSTEIGIPVGSLRNLGSDLSYMFGKRSTSGVNSPTDLSMDRLNLYNELGQNIYDSFIKKTGRKKAKELFEKQSQDVKDNFIKALPGAKKISEIQFDELVFENDYVDFLNSEKEYKEEITTIIDGCIKAYLKSDNFSKDFPEFAGFRSGETGFTSLKNVSKTEERLGIRDANSLARFVAGFDLLKDELVGRCLDYLFTMIEGGKPSIVGIVEMVKDDLDELLNQNPKTGKWSLKEDLETTIDNVKELADISSYTEPSYDTLLASIDQSLKNTPAGLTKKRNELIEKIVKSYIDAFK